MILDIDNVFKTYTQAQKKIDVLKGSSLKVDEGKIISIVGPSGSGKSTLLSLISGLDFPDKGRILLAGEDFSKMSEDKLTKFRGRNLGIVFQQFNLIPHLTALENVLLPLEILGRSDLNLAEEALNSVGLSDRRAHFPDQLSGGECQRVAIARAIVTKPKLILADEPSGNLDARTADQVMKMLFTLVRNYKLTMVLVTHNEALADICDQKFTLSDGILK